MAFNKVILIGNLVADPELKQTPTGVSVATFRIAVQRRFAKPDDAVQADFFNIVVWRQQAEFVSRYFTKGSSAVVCGSLQNRDYTDQNGQKRTFTEIVADEVTFPEVRDPTASRDPQETTCSTVRSRRSRDLAETPDPQRLQRPTLKMLAKTIFRSDKSERVTHFKM